MWFYFSIDVYLVKFISAKVDVLDSKLFPERIMYKSAFNFFFSVILFPADYVQNFVGWPWSIWTAAK